MRGFSDFSGFCCLNDRILLHAFGKDEGAAALRYAREAGDADKDRILVLCDGEAEEIIEKAQGYVPDTVNIYRAAAFSLVWKNVISDTNFVLGTFALKLRFSRSVVGRSSTKQLLRPRGKLFFSLRILAFRP